VKRSGGTYAQDYSHILCFRGLRVNNDVSMMRGLRRVPLHFMFVIKKINAL